MKLIHLSDLHLGKKVHEASMLEDQRYILQEILGIIDEEAPEAVLIAGDVYDKSVPSAEAVRLLDDFLVELSKRPLQTCLISGNHDSPERLSFGGRLMEKSGVHIAPVYDGTLTPLTLTDAYGPVDIYLLPFLKPAHVRRFFPEREITSYTDAMAAVLEAAEVDTDRRNVLVTHQFVTAGSEQPDRSDSEELSVGGTDNVEACVFDAFDYAALGHIHGPQKVGRETVRYCGTPLKYSFSEAHHRKSVTVVELEEKGTVRVSTRPLTPMRDMVELRGTYNEIMLHSFYDGTSWQDDYIHITLTDEDDIPNAIGKLRAVYRNLLLLSYDNTRTRSSTVVQGAEEMERKTPLMLLEEFYEQQNGLPMNEEQQQFAQKMIEDIWEGQE
ncbi:exonuclease SbcCD subunit D [uncultured Agathobaculum sp.]|uniref:exonuclease SbcCD subunit D n=1 Tax=uncultured Agathobaculum sp. TaxID=2048140 RepID=UPI00296E85F4